MDNFSVCQFFIRHKNSQIYTQKCTRYFMEFHKEQLQKCCRVCGRRLKTFNGKGRSFACTSNSKLLLETFSIDVSQDYSDTHPPEYCFSCQGVIRRKVAADKKGLPYNTHTTYNLFQWYTHTEEVCEVK